MSTRMGKVISFYSFKGGVGRTMALANTACLLARHDTRPRVLMIDWDLEAPGLHRYFPEPGGDGNGAGEDGSHSLGLLDLWLEIETQSGDVSSVSEERAEAILSNITWEQYIRPTNEPNLSVMTAGRMDAGYSHRTSHFDWEGLFHRAPSLFQQFANTLSQQFDFVLIDSRTGLTDISGICAMLLPETLVVVFTPNRQSLDGTTSLVRRATQYRRHSEDLRPLLVYPLVARVEMSERTLYHQWRFDGISGYQKRFESLFQEVYDLEGCSLQTYFDNVQIPHVARYSYGEEIAVQREESADTLSLSLHYQHFVRYLTEFESAWASEAVVVDDPMRLYLSVGRSQSLWANSFTKRLTEAGFVVNSPLEGVNLGVAIASQIQRDVVSSDAVLYICGDKQNGEDIRYEAWRNQLLMESETPIIPVYLSKMAVKKAPNWLQDRQGVYLWEEGAAERLMESLKSMAAARGKSLAVLP